MHGQQNIKKLHAFFNHPTITSFIPSNILFISLSVKYILKNLSKHFITYIIHKKLLLKYFLHISFRKLKNKVNKTKLDE